MHELGICRNIVAIVGAAADGRRVRRVNLDVGKFAGVMSEALAFCFPIAAEGTSIADAALAIHEIPGRARCNACEAMFELASLTMPCACGCRRLTRIAGEELIVRSIEMDEAS